MELIISVKAKRKHANTEGIMSASMLYMSMALKVYIARMVAKIAEVKWVGKQLINP